MLDHLRAADIKLESGLVLSGDHSMNRNDAYERRRHEKVDVIMLHWMRGAFLGTTRTVDERGRLNRRVVVQCWARKRLIEQVNKGRRRARRT